MSTRPGGQATHCCAPLVTKPWPVASAVNLPAAHTLHDEVVSEYDPASHSAHSLAEVSDAIARVGGSSSSLMALSEAIARGDARWARWQDKLRIVALDQGDEVV